MVNRTWRNKLCWNLNDIMYFSLLLTAFCTRASWTVSWSIYFVYTCNKFSRVDWGIFTSNFKLMQWALLPASKMQLDSAASAINANLVRNAKCCKLIVSETGGDLFMTNNFILFAMIHLVITVYARKCHSQAISCKSSECKQFLCFLWSVYLRSDMLSNVLLIKWH